MAVSNDQLFALLTDKDIGLAALRQAIGQAAAPKEEPKSSSDDAINAFIKKYTPSTPAEFTAKYGVAPQANLQPLTQPLVPEQVSDYAKEGYDVYGHYHGGPTTIQGEGTPEAVKADAINIIAHGTPDYYTGWAATDADVCAVGLCNNFISKGMWMNGMGSSSYQWPVTYKGIAFPDYVAGMVGGPPSGGG
jgi:hypothetical protein